MPTDNERQAIIKVINANVKDDGPIREWSEVIIDIANILGIAEKVGAPKENSIHA